MATEAKQEEGTITVGEPIVQTLRKQLEERVEALRPVAQEFQEAEQALHALERVNGTGTPAPEATTPAPSQRRGRSGKRADEAEKLVQENPGITISDLAKRMGIKPNYLYRVMPQMEAAGKVRKEDKGYVPVS